MPCAMRGGTHMDIFIDTNNSFLLLVVRHLLLVARHLLLVVRPGAPSSVLAPSSMAS